MVAEKRGVLHNHAVKRCREKNNKKKKHKIDTVTVFWSIEAIKEKEGEGEGEGKV